jgi:hypothetical protein
MKMFILLGMVMGTVTNALAANCNTAVTNAAAVETLQSDVYFHCVGEQPTYNNAQDDYSIKFDCVGQTGSGSLNYVVSFTDDASCLGATVTQTP